MFNCKKYVTLGTMLVGLTLQYLYTISGMFQNLFRSDITKTIAISNFLIVIKVNKKENQLGNQ